MTESPDTQDEVEFIAVGEAPIAEAKRLQSLLEGRGVAMRLASDPEGCNSCSPRVALFVRETDIEKFQNLLKEEHERALGGLEADSERSQAVFDSEKEQATCPACGTVFSTKLAECPDCGLGFAIA